MQASLFPLPAYFDGKTYEPQVDQKRLETLLGRVEYALKGGRWWTLRDLADVCGGSEASVSARLRDLRKPRFGGHRIERKRLEGGLYAYRMPC
jgi:hypothetical protein